MKLIKHGLKVLLLTLMLTTSFSVIAQEVNINTADAQTMADALNGIGLKKAEAIVNWRTEHGNFSQLSELENVKGIGEKTIAKNKDNIKF